MTTNYDDVGRAAMLRYHSVFKVHDIPPAMYYGSNNIPSRVRPEFRTGDVCSLGLWDEVVDEPVSYPFTADNSGLCYIAKYNGPTVYGMEPYCLQRKPPSVSSSNTATTAGPVSPTPKQSSEKEGTELRGAPPAPCQFTCKWSD